jgi:hypothetical protein
VSSLPAGAYVVYFDPTCDGTVNASLASEYNGGVAAFDNAKAIALNAGSSDGGVNASLVAGASISGTVSAVDATESAGICVYAVDAATFDVIGVGVTVGGGSFKIANLPPDTYYVFIDPTCFGTQVSDYGTAYFGANNPITYTLVPGENVEIANSLEPATPPAIATVAIPDGAMEEPYSVQLNVTGGTAPFSWSASGLPSGVSIDAATGQLLGTPTVAGQFTADITVTDSSVPPSAATVALSVNIEPPPGATTTLAPASTTTTTAPTVSAIPTSTATTVAPISTAPIATKATSETKPVRTAVKLVAFSAASVSLGKAIDVAVKVTPKKGGGHATGTVTATSDLSVKVKGKTKTVVETLARARVTAVSLQLTIKTAQLPKGPRAIVISYGGSSKYKAAATTLRILLKAP